MGLGLGSVIVAAAASPAFPLVEFVLGYKEPMFAGVGVLLGANWYLMVRYIPSSACEPGAFCDVHGNATRMARWMFWASVSLYVVSLFATYLLLPIVLLFEE